MSSDEKIIIVGASIAGVFAAKSLRKEGFTGDIVMINREEHLPYDRPPLSKEWMLGEETDEDILLKSPEFYEKYDIELIRGSEVVKIDARAKSIHTNHQDVFSYDKLLLTIGMNLTTLDVEGSNLSGVHYLRTLSDAKAIKEQIANVQDAVVVGGGFIGSEMAATLTALGVHVTIVEAVSHPLEQVVGRDVSNYMMDIHRQHGVDVLTEEMVTAFTGTESLEGIKTKSGQEVPCQLAIVGVGVKPNDSVSHPDLETDQGFVVDEYGQTSLPDVFAAGDCVSWPFRGEQIHIEHWEHAANQATSVAKNMIQTESEMYNIVPYFWSDQYDQAYEYLGHAKDWDTTVLRGSFESGRFSMIYLDEHRRPKAVFYVNELDTRDEVEPFMERQQPVDPATLQDTTVSLKDL